VREFARLNPLPSEGEGGAASAAEGEGASSKTADAEEGMAAMSRRFHEEGGELYVPAGE
jgi:hypothetical protein